MTGNQAKFIGGLIEETTKVTSLNVLYRNSYDPVSRPDIDGIMPKRRDIRPVDAQDEQYGYYKNWAWSWMDNQRILYNINETNPGVKTFFVWFAMNENVWLGLDKAAIWSEPLYDPTKPSKNPLSQGMPLHNEPLESPDAELASEYPTMWGDYYKVRGEGSYHISNTLRCCYYSYVNPSVKCR